MQNEARYLTVAQAAELIQTSPEMVRRLLREGRLRGKRLGGKRAGWRVPASAVERYLDPDAEPEPSSSSATNGAPRLTVAGRAGPGLAPLLEQGRAVGRPVTRSAQRGGSS